MLNQYLTDMIHFNGNEVPALKDAKIDVETEKAEKSLSLQGYTLFTNSIKSKKLRRETDIQTGKICTIPTSHASNAVFFSNFLTFASENSQNVHLYI